MKKKIPLALRNLLDKSLSESPSIIRAEIDSNAIVIFKEKNDTTSPFYFKVESVNTQNKAETTYIVEFLPSNPENFNSQRHAASLEIVARNIKNWLNLLREYNKESLIFEDIFTQKYYEELEPQFVLLDEDANLVPFNLKQQDYILSFLKSAKQLVEKQKNFDNDEETKEIVLEIEETEKLMSKSTKSENLNRIRKIIAKVYKFRYELGKELLIEFTADVLKAVLSAIGASILR